MIAAEITKNEIERLEALAKLQLLDTPIEERFERITRMVCRLLDVPISSFTLVDEFRQWFKSVQGLSNIETPRGISFCAHAVMMDAPLCVPDVQKDDRFSDNPLVTGAPYIASYLGYPVRSSDGYCIGTICAIDRKPRDFTPEQMQLLQDMAAMVEAELRVMEFSASHKQLIQDLSAAEKLALVDSLTRIWNRAGIMQILDREWAEATRLESFVGILSVDIDHFKRINDTYGHPIGDRVLQETARRLLSVLRTYDAMGRVGGEEFLVVLPGCPPTQLQQVAKRMLGTLKAEPITGDGALIPVTASIGGLAVTPAKGYKTKSVLEAADKALYRAKEAGRDRFEMESFRLGG